MSWRTFELSVILLLVSWITVNGFNCTDEDTLCQVCKRFGETDGVYTFFANAQCSIYAGVQDETEEFSVPERCELLFSKLYQTSCQMAIISNVDLLSSYIQYGIRSSEHSMLLSLNRENCTSTWNWWSRLENKTTTAGVGNASEPCDVVQGAFVGFNLVRINPSNFTPTGVLCQCSRSVSFLPTVAPVSDNTWRNFGFGMTTLISLLATKWRYD